MKFLVLAADAQSGVCAGSKEVGGDPQRHAGDDPHSVETCKVKTCRIHLYSGNQAGYSVACLEWRRRTVVRLGLMGP